MSENEQLVNEFKSRGGLKRISGALFYSLQGFKSAWKTEQAFRQELMVAVPASLLALWLPVAPLEKLLLIGVLVLVLMMELVNSAIEAVVDRISLESHPLSKNAKDLGSAVVFLALALAAATWIVILLPILRR
jgi:diacylglycerol kinase (ATP)